MSRGHSASGSQTAPEEVLSVASTMVHRFYMRRSFEDFDEKVGYAKLEVESS
jgi:hypothetical protein